MKVMLYCGFTCKDIGAYKEVHSPCDGCMTLYFALLDDDTQIKSVVIC